MHHQPPPPPPLPFFLIHRTIAPEYISDGERRILQIENYFFISNSRTSLVGFGAMSFAFYQVLFKRHISESQGWSLAHSAQVQNN